MDRQQTIERYFAGTPFLVRGKAYPSPLPPELADWYCYTSDGGHSILCLLEENAGAAFASHAEFENLVPAPVKAVLRGYRIVHGYVVADLAYDPDLGLITEAEDDEF